MKLVVLSHYQAEIALEARRVGMDKVTMSLDLGMHTVEVPILPAGIPISDHMLIKWEEIEHIAKSQTSCFELSSESPRVIHYYSELTERAYSLYPTSGAPTMLVSGIPMHRIKDTDPFIDTLEKIRAIKPVVGQVLDTATGLGYTAIQAAKSAEHVMTIELDPAALQICRSNPWSQELFDNPKISQIVGDSFDVVANMDSASFTRVIHDPPAFSLAGDLYSLEFYQELYRVMRNRSQLYHYIGDPESKSGRSITAGVIRRLEQAGFRQVRRAPRAFGVVAVK
jgi:predicted methyltransferase